jgi:hypothetical protein
MSSTAATSSGSPEPAHHGAPREADALTGQPLQLLAVRQQRGPHADGRYWCHRDGGQGQRQEDALEASGVLAGLGLGEVGGDDEVGGGDL